MLIPNNHSLASDRRDHPVEQDGSGKMRAVMHIIHSIATIIVTMSLYISANAETGSSEDDRSTVYQHGTPEELMTKMWYHEKISHKVAEMRLKTETSDCFLLRSIERGAANFSLAVKYRGAIKHYLIERSVTDEYELKGTEKSFPSILKLIHYYMEHPILADGELLWTPCSKNCSGINGMHKF